MGQPPWKGRGAVSNPANRFETQHVERFDDGWTAADPEPPQRVETTAIPEKTCKILTTNDSPDVGFDVSINPYKGCEHGCIYCFARQTHSYLGLSPGLDFETKIFTKPDAPELLRHELSRKGYVCKPLALGANTDPYQPLERELRITRRVLEVLAEFRHPVTIVTKSNLVLRDLDLLAPMAAARRASVCVSVTSLDREIARTMEPRAPTPERRLDAVRELSRAGVPVAVLVSPIIPGLTDVELERILEAAAAAGASSATYLVVRLPHEIKALFQEWLHTHYPSKAERVLALIRDMRGGRLNDPRWGKRMSAEGPLAEVLRRRFEVVSRRLGLDRDERFELDTSAFRVPGRPMQRSLFG